MRKTSPVVLPANLFKDMVDLVHEMARAVNSLLGIFSSCRFLGRPRQLKGPLGL